MLHVIVTTKWLLTSGPSNCTLLPPLFLLCRINPTECSQIAFRGGWYAHRSPSDPRFTSHCFYSQIQSRLKTSNQSVPITLQARILLALLPLRINVQQKKRFIQQGEELFTSHSNLKWGVVAGLLVKALDCRSKGPGFQSHLQQRFISLLGALSPTSNIE